MNRSAADPSRVLPVALILCVAGLALYLPRLGASDLWDPWEPRYTHAASEMRERGDFVVPWYRDDPRLNRPPMTYWLIAASQAVAGPSEIAARLPSALLYALCPAALAWALQPVTSEGNH